MRLIDLDKVSITIYASKEVAEEVGRQLINAPIVKAIPIEWLYQKRTLYLENECYMSLMVINELLNWWEKENEKGN